MGPYFWVHSILEKDQVTQEPVCAQGGQQGPVTLVSNPTGCGRRSEAPASKSLLSGYTHYRLPLCGSFSSSASGTPGAPTLPLLDPTQGASGPILGSPSRPGQLCSPQLEKDDFTLPESSSMQYLHKYSPTPGTGVQNCKQAICGVVQPPPTHSEPQAASPNLRLSLKLLLRLQMGPTRLHPTHKSNWRGTASDGQNARISVVPSPFSFKVNSP